MEKCILNVYRKGRPTEIHYIKEDDNDKYGLLVDPVTKMVDGNGYTVYQIVALKTFGDVRIGQLGGYVASFSNLSKFDDCWLSGENTVVVGTTEVKDQSLLENVSCIDSIFAGECDICGNSEDSFIRESRISDSALYGKLRVMKSNIYGSELEGSKLCKVLMSDLHYVKSDDDVEVIEIIRSKLDNLVFYDMITSLNVKLEICANDPATIDDVIFVEGSDWESDSFERVINIYRTLFKNQRFSWEKLLEFVDSDGIRPVKKEDTQNIEFVEQRHDNNVQVQNNDVVAKSNEEIERELERKNARSSIEDILGSLAGK